MFVVTGPAFTTYGSVMEHRLQQLEEPLTLPSYESPGIAKTKRWKRAWGQRLTVATLVLSDVLLALLVWETASLLQGVWGQGELSPVTVATALPVVAVWLGLRALLGLYPGYGLDSVETLRRQTYAVFAGVAMLAIFAVGFQVGEHLSRLLLALFFLGLLVLAPLTQHFVKRALREAGLWGRPVIIFGSGQNEGRVRGRVVKLLQEKWDLGYNPVAVFNCQLSRLAPARPTPLGRSQEDSPYVETLARAADLAHRLGLDTAIFAMPHTRREQVADIVGVASIRFRHVLVIPNLNGVTNSAVVARDLGGTLAVEIKYNLLNPWALRAKRVADLVSTVIGGILVLPLLLVLAALVFVESGGPVFYKDRRMGRDGNLFSCVKFSTMVPNAEALLQRMIEEDPGLKEEYSKYHKLRNDPRVTRVGHFLRKTSLDELPQLWNVLRGEMSLVGPRPYLPRESREIGVTQSEILRVPPGITGPWQVAGRNHASFDERVQMDAYYVRDWSVWLDLILLARTAKTVLLSRGAY